VGTLDARLEVRVDNETLSRLEQKAVRDGLSLAQAVRAAVNRYLADADRDTRLASLHNAFALGGPVPADPARLKQEIVAGRFDDTPSERSGPAAQETR
jgi:hypothetical protein